MSIFDDRERAAEFKFEQERDLSFRITARRNKLIGLWVAGRMGLNGDAATRYAFGLVEEEITEHGDAALVARIRRDLAAAGTPLGEAEIRQELSQAAARARAQLIAEAG